MNVPNLDLKWPYVLKGSVIEKTIRGMTRKIIAAVTQYT